MTPHPDQITTLERLLAEATPGPWQSQNDYDWFNIIGGIDGPDNGVLTYSTVCDCDPYCNQLVEQRANAALIVAMRAALPSLLAAVRENVELREAIKLARGLLLYPTNDMFNSRGDISVFAILAIADTLSEVEPELIKPALNQPLEGGSSAQDRHPASVDLTSSGSERAGLEEYRAWLRNAINECEAEIDGDRSCVFRVRVEALRDALAALPLPPKATGDASS